MSKLLTIGQRMFSLGFIALAILCFVHKDFIIGRPPVSNALNPVFAYLAATIIILLGLAIFFQQKVKEASLLIAAMIFLLSVTRHIPYFMDDYLNTYKALAFIGGALIISTPFMTNRRIIRDLLFVGAVFLSIFFIACGYAHIKYYVYVKDYIPAYIPFRGFFTYFTAICLIAGGIGIHIPYTRKLAALLSGIMVFSWFILLHIPRYLANMNDVSDRMGLFESFAFAGIFFVLTAIFRNREGITSETK